MIGIAKPQEGIALALGLILIARDRPSGPYRAPGHSIASDRQRDLNAAATGDHVKVGQDETVIVDQETRAKALRGDRLIEKIAADRGAGDINGGELRKLVNVDIVLLVRVQSGTVDGRRIGPLEAITTCAGS